MKAGCGLKEWPPRGLPKSCTAISVMENRIRKLLEEELVCPNLQILLLNNNSDLNEIPEKFIKNLSFLRVLDLSNTQISVLPQSFSLLINLQALYLDYCKRLIDISIVGSLKKLEIFSMIQCSISLWEISRDKGHLTNLRILDANGAKDLIIPSKVISKLHKLEELYTLHCGFEDWGSKVVREGEETELGFAGLSNLKFLQVCISDAKYMPKNVKVEPDWEYFYIYIGSHFKKSFYPDYKSRTLVLETAIMSSLPDWFINAVAKKTEKLEYYNCKGMSDIAMEYDHGRLHKLKHLKVSNSDYSWVDLKELMNITRRVQTGPVFENLEELHLRHLDYLEELCVGELPPGSLFNLKVFHVDECKMLKNVSKFVQKLPNLEKLELNRMNELDYVFRCEGFEPEQPKLREMRLWDLKALRSICNGPAPPAMFQSLKILTFHCCKVLQSLFTSDVAQCLVQLEDLIVESCPLLERVVEAVNNEKTVLPKLKKLVLEDLPMLYGPSATTADIECPSLEHLIVVECTHISFSISSEESSESRNPFLTSASNYFGSRNTVQLRIHRQSCLFDE